MVEELQFLNPPSFAGFDGGAGVRYQARREIRSYWYPTWLAQPAALVPGSKLVDVPSAGLTLDDIMTHTPDRELLTDMDRLPFVTPVYQRDLVKIIACGAGALR
jgi:hypothetical protein